MPVNLRRLSTCLRTLTDTCEQANTYYYMRTQANRRGHTRTITDTHGQTGTHGVIRRHKRTHTATSGHARIQANICAHTRDTLTHVDTRGHTQTHANTRGHTWTLADSWAGTHAQGLTRTHADTLDTIRTSMRTHHICLFPRWRTRHVWPTYCMKWWHHMNKYIHTCPARETMSHIHNTLLIHNNTLFFIYQLNC